MLWHDSGTALAIAAEPSPAREWRTPSGEVLKQRRLSGFTVQQVRYHPGTEISAHCHEQAYVTLVTEGHYLESYGGEFFRVGTGALRYLPAGFLHANRFPSEMTCLRVEIQQRVLDQIRESSRMLERPGEIQGVPAAWLANRLLLEFHEQDSVSGMALEGMLMEILAEGARSLQAKASGPTPRWLRSARAFLEMRFLEDIRLNDVAQIAGVHPVHLAREFRRHYRRSIGEFVRELRVAHASRLLAHSSTPIAEIAINCGFSDQSHFSSVFKKQMGVTPAKFREAS